MRASIYNVFARFTTAPSLCGIKSPMHHSHAMMSFSSRPLAYLHPADKEKMYPCTEARGPPYRIAS